MLRARFNNGLFEVEGFPCGRIEALSEIFQLGQ
jgi:hypothetical protein